MGRSCFVKVEIKLRILAKLAGKIRILLEVRPIKVVADGSLK